MENLLEGHMVHQEISRPVAGGAVVSVLPDEIEAIRRDIEADPELISDANDFKDRWLKVEMEGSEKDFAELPVRMNDFRDIVGRNSKDERASFLTVDVLKLILEID